MTTWPLFAPSSFGSVITCVTQRESVWKGAWGMSPLGAGIPRRPATPVVRPRRKRSQWKPAGLRRGNSVPWAMRDDTICFYEMAHLESGGLRHTIVVKIE